MHKMTLLFASLGFAASIVAYEPLEPPQPSTLALMMTAPENHPDAMQPYKAKDYSYLLSMPGFSDHALNMHFTLYRGYVKNTNLFFSLLNRLTVEGKQSSPYYQEIKRRLGWEFDGMALHELYFSNLGGKNSSLDPSHPLYQKILDDFGSYDAWHKDFVATGMLRGIGWVVLYQDPIEGRLINTWVGEHDSGNLAGGKPLLVMDVWEHAYIPDYGIDRPAYINAFFKNVDWSAVTKRFAS